MPDLDLETRTPPGTEPPAKRRGLLGLYQTIRYGLSTPIPEDLSKKEVSRQVITIAWPTMAESFLLQLASMLNLMMVGSLGDWATAAVGYCTQPRMLIMAVFQAFNTGSTALIARSKGANDVRTANLVMHQSIIISFFLSLIMGLLGYTFATPMMQFMGAETEQTIQASTQYFQIIMLSFPFNALSVAVTAILRGIGKTRISMTYNIIANVLNVIVGFIFINGNFGMPRLGVAGAGLGMASGQVVAFCISIIPLARGTEMLKLRFKNLFKIDLNVLKRVSNIGAPAMLEQFFMRFGQIMFAKIVASLGTAAFATHTIATNIFQMSMMNGQAFGVSATSLLGQSLGRKRPDHGKAAVQYCRRYAMIVSLVLGLTMFFFGEFLVSLYSTDPETIRMGGILLKVVGILQPLQGSQQTLSGALRGAGDTKAVALCTFIGIVIIRPIVSLTNVYVFNWGLVGIWVAIVCDQSIRSFYSMWRFASDKWRTLKV